MNSKHSSYRLKHTGRFVGYFNCSRSIHLFSIDISRCILVNLVSYRTAIEHGTPWGGYGCSRILQGSIKSIWERGGCLTVVVYADIFTYVATSFYV